MANTTNEILKKNSKNADPEMKSKLHKAEKDAKRANTEVADLKLDICQYDE